MPALQSLSQDATAAKHPHHEIFGLSLLWVPGSASQALISLAHADWEECSNVQGRPPSARSFIIPASSGRLEIVLRPLPGSHPRVSVETENTGFSFFPHNVSKEYPIWIPEYGVAVTVATDLRDYWAITQGIQARGLTSNLEKIHTAPEAGFASAAARNRRQVAPVWLGLGRDMRIFRMWLPASRGYSASIEPCYHTNQWGCPESDHHPYRLDFAIGRGIACEENITCHLEEGCLPMAHWSQIEDDITYEIRAFATLETQTLQPDRVRGSHWLASLYNTGFHMLGAEEIAENRPLIDAEMTGREEEVVCCLRIEAVNHGPVPEYAWFKAVRMFETGQHHYDGTAGFSQVGPERVYAVHRLNGRPVPHEEVAILIPPGGRAVWEVLIPHQPINRSRALALAGLDMEDHATACRDFWMHKLSTAASIEVPEPEIAHRIRAGILHCDLVTLGQESGGPLLATPGCYAPIGSESAPMIQFYDAIGWHDTARRCLEFFLLRQREDGFMQNFNNYQLETGPILWTIGEHFRHTRDADWIRKIATQLIKACDYLIAWRHRPTDNGKSVVGPHLQAGKVADPDDFFSFFSLNAYSWLGLQRAAEILSEIGHADGARLKQEAAAYREDIRASFREALRSGPVIPLSDGTWVPTAGPWAGYPGPLALYAEGGEWFTHGGFGARDSLIGALYLVFCGVFDPGEREAEFLLKFHQQLFTRHNAALSQPYYCRNDWIHLARGEVKAFLQLFYNQLTALQDRENLTFHEHFYHVSTHKTHEEAWFLIQVRWMLWREEQDTLHLLSAIPRQWMQAGNHIHLKNVSTTFGPLTLRVEAESCGRKFTAEILCMTDRPPKTIRLRLPHPREIAPSRVTGGTYDPQTETVTFSPSHGSASLVCEFPEPESPATSSQQREKSS